MLAAEQGHVYAQYNLGWMYDSGGRGFAQSLATAFKWYGLSAQQGHPPAQVRMGLAFQHGRGVSQDYQAAVKWYSLAAEQGDTDAQYNLGYMYANGFGVSQDYIRGYMWWSIAAQSGAKDNLDGKDEISKSMTPSQFEKAQELARECVAKDYKDC